RGDDLRQRRHQSRFARDRIACFECVVELPLHPKPPYAAAVKSPYNLLPTEPPHQAPTNGVNSTQKTRRRRRRVSSKGIYGRRRRRVIASTWLLNWRIPHSCGSD